MLFYLGLITQRGNILCTACYDHFKSMQGGIDVRNVSPENDPSTSQETHMETKSIFEDTDTSNEQTNDRFVV